MHQSHPKDPSVAPEIKLPPLEDEKPPGPRHKGEGGSGFQEGTDPATQRSGVLGAESTSSSEGFLRRWNDFLHRSHVDFLSPFHIKIPPSPAVMVTLCPWGHGELQAQ